MVRDPHNVSHDFSIGDDDVGNDSPSDQDVLFKSDFFIMYSFY